MVDIKEIKELARNVGLSKTGKIGKCLSHRYINDKSKPKSFFPFQYHQIDLQSKYYSSFKKKFFGLKSFS